MESDIITAILYTEVHDELGPNPKYWIPTDLPTEIQMHIAIKTITLLTSEQGIIPKSLVFIPFPSLNLKGLIKYIEFKDESLRGGMGTSAITLLFKETDDVIFYNYFMAFESVFNDIAKKIKVLEEARESKEKFAIEFDLLCTEVEQLLDKLKIKEHTTIETSQFPEKEALRPELVQFKLSVVGDVLVGKTSLVLRFTKKAFKRSYLPTLGVNVSSKILPIKDVLIQLVIWDIAGQQKFESMRTQFYMGTRGVLMTFDITSQESFESIKNWHEDIKNHLKKGQSFTGYIIGNKSDLSEKRVITTENAQALAKKLNLKYIETSALTGENVDEVFNKLAEDLYDLYSQLE